MLAALEPGSSPGSNPSDLSYKAPSGGCVRPLPLKLWTICSLGFMLQMQNLCPRPTHRKNLHFDKILRLFNYSLKFGKQIRDLIFAQYLLLTLMSLPRSMLFQLNKRGKVKWLLPGFICSEWQNPDVVPSLGPDLDSRSWGLRLSHIFRLVSLGFRMMPFLAFPKAQLVSSTSS